VDERGRPLDLDLYDASTWRRLGLAPDAGSRFQERLDRAAALHRALEQAPAPPDALVIGARHLPTPSRAVVVSGRARLPPPPPRRDDPFVGFPSAPGDGEPPEASLSALPGQDPRRLWFATPEAHHRLPSDPGVHDLVLEALLATDRTILDTKLQRSLP